ncbi:hypothetical protein AVEN_92328-1 [Araneus ventricosus]|uniref:Uncharacterized protein n=1 Tax=Araneus ventricosus TaxID=182803 RepID=A0A4Y2AKP7_ARAVE|nr:hypothetical protein AVEN_92328-1 [Araneus ventricosus]
MVFPFLLFSFRKVHLFLSHRVAESPSRRVLNFKENFWRRESEAPQRQSDVSAQKTNPSGRKSRLVSHLDRSCENIPLSKYIGGSGSGLSFVLCRAGRSPKYHFVMKNTTVTYLICA